MDESTEREWRRCARRLADRLSDSVPGSQFLLVPKFEREEAAYRAMLVRSTVAETVSCVAFGLDSPALPWRASEVGNIHVLEDPVEWVDRFASTVVAQIRGAWNLPHPSFLKEWDSEHPIDPVAQSAGDFVMPRVFDNVGELTDAVGAALSARFDDVEPLESDDGFFVTDDFGCTLYVHVAGIDEVRVHACVVEQISGRTRAAEVIGDLARRHSRLTFLLVEDTVHIAVGVDARPFLAQHVFNALTRISDFAFSVDDAFAEALGGVVHRDNDVVALHDAFDSPDAGDIPPKLMALLEMDAESGGKIDATAVVSVCGTDRFTMEQYEAFCAGQAESWRENAGDARLREDHSAAEKADAEAVPWERVVRALQVARRTVGFSGSA